MRLPSTICLWISDIANKPSWLMRNKMNGTNILTRAAPNDYFKQEIPPVTKTDCVPEMTQPKSITGRDITVPKKSSISEKIQPNQAGLLPQVPIAPPRRKRSVTGVQNMKTSRKSLPEAQSEA